VEGRFEKREGEAKVKEYLSPFERIVCASVGASLTVLATMPLDVIKTRVQAAAAAHADRGSSFSSSGGSSSSGSSVSSSRAASLALSLGGGGSGSSVCGGSRRGTVKTALSTAAALVRSEGVAALWRGLAPSLLMAVPAQTLYFVFYESCRSLFERGGSSSLSSALAPMTAGMVSRALVVIALAPLELVRTQAMAARGVARLPLLEALRNEARGAGLWRGLLPTLVRDVPFSGIYWAAYETAKASIYNAASGGRGGGLSGHTSLSTSWATSFVAGLAAGTLAAAVTTPFDVVKTRLQLGENTRGNGALATFLHVARGEGLQGLFSGVILRVARVGPACAIMISSYESGKRLFLTTRNIGGAGGAIS
jgi:solute carrier family 25 protein 39/40